MFKEARLKLTGWYLLIIMIISFIFSVVIYALVDREINRFSGMQRIRIERQLSPPPTIMNNWDKDLVEESKKRLLTNLLVINGAILVISGSLAYMLAGRTLKPIQEMSEEQKRFIADASHELRTPLTGLKTMLEVNLRDKRFDLRDSKKAMNQALIQVDNMKKLTDYLLKLDNRNIEPKTEGEESIKKIMSTAIQTVKTEAENKKIKIISISEKGRLRSDIEKVTDTLVIILDNAIKYSPKNKEIKFRGFPKGSKTVFEIEDQGIGIKTEDLGKIFTRFYRTDNARSKNAVSGFGLGLSIAKKNVESLKGEIKVESQLGRGSKFQVIFS